MQVAHSLPRRYSAQEESFVSSLIRGLFGPLSSARYLDEDESSWPIFSYSLEHDAGLTGINLSFTRVALGEVSGLRSLLTMLASLPGENVPKLSTVRIQGDEQRCYAMQDATGEVVGFVSLEGDRLGFDLGGSVTSTIRSGLVASLHLPFEVKEGVHVFHAERVRASISSALNVTHFGRVVIMENALVLDQPGSPSVEDEVPVTLTLGRFSLPLATLFSLRNGSSLQLSGFSGASGSLQVGGADVARASVQFQDGVILVKVEEIL